MCGWFSGYLELGCKICVHKFEYIDENEICNTNPSKKLPELKTVADELDFSELNFAG